MEKFTEVALATPTPVCLLAGTLILGNDKHWLLDSKT